MNFIIKSIDQIGYIVKDVEKWIQNYENILGIKSWVIKSFFPPLLHNLSVYGKPANFSMKVGYAKVGALEIEPIEPLEGESIYKEFLEEKGGGVHHIQTYYPKLDDMQRDLYRLENQGIRVIQSGWIGDTLHFAYLDTEATLGIVLELCGGTL